MRSLPNLRIPKGPCPPHSSRAASKAGLARAGAVLLLVVLFAPPAWSDDDEPSALAEYGSTVGNRALMGINSLLTWPADPVMAVVEPREEFDELPGSVVTSRIVGLPQGALLAAYRAGMGLIDLTFSWVTPVRMLSPVPRYQIFENAEHEWY